MRAALVAIALVACDDSVGPTTGLTLTISARPEADSLLVGDTLLLVADVRDANDTPRPELQVAWVTSHGIPLGTGSQVTVTLVLDGSYAIVASVVLAGTEVARASIPVTVLPNSRPHIELLVTPRERFYASDTAVFVAQASDAESEVTQITWHSDVLGLIGEGDTLRWVPGEGAVGLHLITARAHDPQGNRDDVLHVVRVFSAERFLWTFQPEDGSIGSGGAMLALADDGSLYAGFPWIASCLNCVWAVSPDGEPRWTYSLESSFWDHSSGLTVGPDGRVFVFDFRGIGYALAPTGALIWQNTILGGDPHGRYALAPDGALFAAGRKRDQGIASLVRVAPETGEILWKVERQAAYRNGPAIAPDGKMTFQPSPATLVVSPNGTVLREDTLSSSASGRHMSAMDADGVTYYSSSGGTLSAVGLDGTVRWQLDLGSRPGEPVIGPDGMIYVAAGSTAYAVRADGIVLWESLLSGSSWIPRLALLANGTLWVALGEHLFLLSAATGETLDVVEFLDPVQSALAVAPNGVVYVITDDNRLIALEGPAGLDPNAPWPIWRGDNRRTASVAR